MDASDPSLVSRRSEILERWLAAVGDSYPAAASPLRRNADRFRNPAAYVLRENLAALVDSVVLAEDWDRAARAMTELAQLRTVQGFDPEAARALGEALKRIVGPCAPDLDIRLDRLGTLAVGLHAMCRERIGEIAAREVGRRTWLLERLRSHLTA